VTSHKRRKAKVKILSLIQISVNQACHDRFRSWFKIYF